MGLFSGQTKTDFRVEPHIVPEERDEVVETVPPLPKPRPSTVITKGVVLSGALKGDGVVQIEGVVEGELELNGSVIVTSTGLVKGPVAADVVRVAGCIEGSVSARDHLRLERTGTIQGDVSTGSLVVEDGGLLNGRSTMVKAPPKPIPSGTSDTPPLEELQFGPNYKVGADTEEEES